MNRTGFVFDEAYLRHATGPGHPERPDRLRAIMDYLQKRDVFDELTMLKPLACTEQQLEYVHPRTYIDTVRQVCVPGLHYLDADTVVSEASYEVARLAAGAALTGCDAVMSGEVKYAFCAARPPGHHAEPNRAMGFCLFNNVAIAARHLQAEYKLNKICIVDWDVHHGNGTQSAFYTDPSVLYISIHQHPLYPGTGHAEERGEGNGVGLNLNLPCSPGLGDEEYEEIFERQVLPSVRMFAPDFLLISAGFDAHRDDPLANMNVTQKGFKRMTEMMMEMAEESCQGRLVSLLEGGYNLEALAGSVEIHLVTLVDS